MDLRPTEKFIIREAEEEFYPNKMVCPTLSALFSLRDPISKFWDSVSALY